jgi:hypothetical protein
MATGTVEPPFRKPSGCVAPVPRKMDSPTAKSITSAALRLMYEPMPGASSISSSVSGTSVMSFRSWSRRCSSSGLRCVCAFASPLHSA